MRGTLADNFTEMQPERDRLSVGVPYTDGTESKGGHIWHLVIGWQRYGAAMD